MEATVTRPEAKKILHSPRAALRFLLLAWVFLAVSCGGEPKNTRLSSAASTPGDRLIECCTQGCVDNSGGRDSCRKLCEDELARHPDNLTSIYCTDFKP